MRVHWGLGTLGQEGQPERVVETEAPRWRRLGIAKTKKRDHEEAGVEKRW
jgi:hypothetical protein